MNPENVRGELGTLVDKLDKIFIPSSLIRSYAPEFLMTPEPELKKMGIELLWTGEILRLAAYASPLVYYLS